MVWLPQTQRPWGYRNSQYCRMRQWQHQLPQNTCDDWRSARIASETQRAPLPKKFANSGLKPCKLKRSTGCKHRERTMLPAELTINTHTMSFPVLSVLTFPSLLTPVANATLGSRLIGKTLHCSSPRGRSASILFLAAIKFALCCPQNILLAICSQTLV